MLNLISGLFFVAATLGVAIVFLTVGLLIAYMRRPPRTTTATPGITILKPLCGVDDDLQLNLENFAALDYPNYEVLLGVKDKKDAAYPVAQAAAERWPGKFKLFLQRGEPGLNPKVNQLITLEKHAQHEIILISDSNTRVAAGYLREVAALFEDPKVGIISQPVAGVGEQTLGSLMDNVHLVSHVGTGMVSAHLAAKLGLGNDIVVGKSMGFRRADLHAMGGFMGAKDYLAEDYVLGKMTNELLGKKVAVARTPVLNVSVKRPVSGFWNRYKRWSVIHRTSVSTGTYLAQTMLNPWPLAAIGFLLAPSPLTFAGMLAIMALKVIADATAALYMRRGWMGLWLFWSIPVKDALLFVSHVMGFFNQYVMWRGNKLKVMPGSRLVLPGHLQPLPALAELDEDEAVGAHAQAQTETSRVA